jgi:gamma-glutamyltranspeptidase / glutathione hydrolase
MLRAGGNAFDAAVAAALAETVLVPSKCGLAGDLIALIRTSTGDVRCLIAIGAAAAGLQDAVAGQNLPVTGGLSVGVPGAPAGYQALAALGVLNLTDVVGPAIDLAINGAAWSPLTHDYTVRSAVTLKEENPEGVRFLPEGQPIAPGTWVRLPGHAEALEEFARVGGGLFHGSLGDLYVRKVTDRGGVITVADLKCATAQWVPPVRSEVAGRDIWATPLPTHGPALLDALQAADTGACIPRDQIERVRDARTRQRDTAGDAGTSVVTASDADGNVVVLVHSLSHPTFGSGLVIPGIDLVLSNRAGRGFTNIAGHPNAPEPGRRPVTTLHAWALGSTALTPFTAGATSGGIQQVPWNVQAIERLIHGEAIANAVLEPLWEMTSDGHIRYETDSITPAAEGTAVPPWSLEAGMQIVQPADDAGVCHVISDIRSVGGAAAA